MDVTSRGREPLRLALILLAAWAIVGAYTGFRLHRAGGLFGEAVGLWPSILVQLALSAPWPAAAALAWWSARTWPVRRVDVLRPLVLHMATGLIVAGSVQLFTAAVETILPLGMRPLNPWARLPELLTSRGPPALAVYLTLVFTCLVIRGQADQEVPGAGIDDPP